MSKKMPKLKIFILILIAVTTYVIVNAVQIWHFGTKDEKQKCDVAIVLGASANADGVSPVFKERINHAIWLYNNGFVDYLIFTGGVGEGNDFSDASKAKEYAMEKGISEDVIFLEEESAITQENLKNSKTIMEKEKLESCIIVSDPLHMKRAMRMANDYGMKAHSSPTPTTRYVGWKTRLQFLIREEFFYIGYKFYKLLPIGEL